MPYDIEVQTGLVALEAFPTSPFILHPFNDALPVPTAMKPGYRQSDGTLTPTATNAWYTRQSTNGRNTVCAPGPGAGMQDSMGKRKRTAGIPGAVCPDAGTHQLWTDGSGASGTTGGINLPDSVADPICYHIRVR
jgi:hypothetical protein